MINRVFNFIDRLSDYAGSIAGAASIIMCLFITVEVGMRYLFNSPIIGADEIGALILIAVVFIGLAYTTHARGHVRVELIMDQAPQKVRVIFEIATWLLALIISILLVWGIWLETAEVFRKHLTSPSLLRIPLLPIYIIMTAGALLMCLQWIVQICRLITSLRAKAPAGREEPASINREF